MKKIMTSFLFLSLSCSSFTTFPNTQKIDKVIYGAAKIICGVLSVIGGFKATEQLMKKQMVISEMVEHKHYPWVQQDSKYIIGEVIPNVLYIHPLLPMYFCCIGGPLLVIAGMKDLFQCLADSLDEK